MNIVVKLLNPKNSSGFVASINYTIKTGTSKPRHSELWLGAEVLVFAVELVRSRTIEKIVDSKIQFTIALKLIPQI